MSSLSSKGAGTPPREGFVTAAGVEERREALKRRRYEGGQKGKPCKGLFLLQGRNAETIGAMRLTEWRPILSGSAAVLPCPLIAPPLRRTACTESRQSERGYRSVLTGPAA